MPTQENWQHIVFPLLLAESIQAFYNSDLNLFDKNILRFHIICKNCNFEISTSLMVKLVVDVFQVLHYISSGLIFLHNIKICNLEIVLRFNVDWKEKKYL